MCIMDQSDCRSLARLAFTSKVWAERVAPSLPTFWERMKDAEAQIAAAASFDELEVVLKRIDEQHMTTEFKGSFGPEFELDEYRNEQRFQDCSRQVAAALSRYDYDNKAAASGRINHVDGQSSTAKRLAVLKDSIEVMDGHGLRVRDASPIAYREFDAQQLLANAITARLRPAEFIGVVRTLGTQDEYQFAELLADLLACNQHRTEFTNADLAQCVQMSLDLMHLEQTDEHGGWPPVLARELTPRRRPCAPGLSLEAGRGSATVDAGSASAVRWRSQTS